MNRTVVAMAVMMFCGALGLAHAAAPEPPARSQQEVATRILRAGAIATQNGDKTANAVANAAAEEARNAPTLEQAQQIYKNFNKRNN